MREDTSHIECYRWKFPPLESSECDGFNGAFVIPFESYELTVVCSDGGGWDHVSVSLKNRCPSWKEMCFIKDLFFSPEETVVQYHPKKSEYVNNHEFCLHLWRNQSAEHVLPPSGFVGTKKPMARGDF